MKSLDLFNTVTSDTIFCKFYQIFIDTMAYMFSCARENQQSVENSEHLVSVCTESEGTFFIASCLFWGLGFGHFFFLCLSFLRGKSLSQLM